MVEMSSKAPFYVMVLWAQMVGEHHTLDQNPSGVFFCAFINALHIVFSLHSRP